MNNCITLNGYMGAGKSTIGRKLEAEIGMPFVDLDEVIENEANCSISEVFELYGDYYFRKLERKMLHKMLKENVIISTGGGTPCFFDNIQLIRTYSQSFYLKLLPQELLSRLINERTKRPLIKDIPENELFKFVENQLIKREKFYTSCEYVIRNIDIEKTISYIQSITNIRS